MRERKTEKKAREVEWTQRIFIQYEGLAFEKLKIRFKDFFNPLTQHCFAAYSLLFLLKTLWTRHTTMHTELHVSLIIAHCWLRVWRLIRTLLEACLCAPVPKSVFYFLALRGGKKLSLLRPTLKTSEKCNTKSEWTESRFFVFRFIVVAWSMTFFIGSCCCCWFYAEESINRHLAKLQVDIDHAFIA